MKLAISGILLAATLLIQGCSTLADARKAEGEGAKRVYPASFEQTWNAANTALIKLKLEIATENISQGHILAQRGMSFASYGENVAVFVRKKTEKETQVEVVSKKSMATNIFAPDWTDDVLNEIGVALKNSAK
jgi:hypothetical protein